MPDAKFIEHVMQQDAIFDGRPEFVDVSLVMNVLNHNSFGGTKKDLLEMRASPQDFPARHGLKRYKVTICVYAEPYNE